MFMYCAALTDKEVSKTCTKIRDLCGNPIRTWCQLMQDPANGTHYDAIGFKRSGALRNFEKGRDTYASPACVARQLPEKKVKRACYEQLAFLQVLLGFQSLSA